MKRINHFLAWEGQTYIGTCSCTRAFLCFSYRRVLERSWSRASTCPVHHSFPGLDLGEGEESNPFSLVLSTHRSAKLSPCKLVDTSKRAPGTSVRRARVIIDFGLKAQKKKKSSLPEGPLCIFILFTLGRGWPATEVFAVNAYSSFLQNKRVCKVHLFPEEYLTA